MKIQIQPDQKLPPWIAVIFVLVILALVNVILLHYHASQHPQGSLKNAAPLFWSALTQPDKSEPPLTALMSSGLAQRYSPEALRTQLLATELDPAYRQPIYSHEYKKRSRKKGDGVTYYQTPEHIVIANWRSYNFWFSKRGWFALRWKVTNACIVEPAVERTSKRLLRELTRSAEAAYTLTIDHAFPQRQVKWITPEQLNTLRQQVGADSGTRPSLTLTQPVRLKPYAFVSQQRWNDRPVEVTFSENGYGKEGCRLRVNKIKIH